MNSNLLKLIALFVLICLASASETTEDPNHQFWGWGSGWGRGYGRGWGGGWGGYGRGWGSGWGRGGWGRGGWGGGWW